jgi:hypothetical protein
MTATPLTLAGKKFVIMSERDYVALTKDRTKPKLAARTRKPHAMTKQDRGDVAEAKRILSDPNEKFVPWEEFRKSLR